MLSEHDKLGIPLSCREEDRFAPSPSMVVGCALVPRQLLVFPASWQHILISRGIHKLEEVSQITALKPVRFAWNNKTFTGLDCLRLIL